MTCARYLLLLLALSLLVLWPPADTKEVIVIHAKTQIIGKSKIVSCQDAK